MNYFTDKGNALIPKIDNILTKIKNNKNKINIPGIETSIKNLQEEVSDIQKEFKKRCIDRNIPINNTAALPAILAMDKFFQDRVPGITSSEILDKLPDTITTTVDIPKLLVNFDLETQPIMKKFFKIFDTQSMSTRRGDNRMGKDEYDDMINVLQSFPNARIVDLLVTMNSKNANMKNPIYSRFMAIKGNAPIPKDRGKEPVFRALQYLNKLSTRNGQPLNNTSQFKQGALRTYLQPKPAVTARQAVAEKARRVLTNQEAKTTAAARRELNKTKRNTEAAARGKKARNNIAKKKAKTAASAEAKIELPIDESIVAEELTMKERKTRVQSTATGVVRKTKGGKIIT